MPKGNTSSGAPTRILVVDDDPAIRWILESTLRDEGFEVDMRPDGRVDGVDLSSFDVLITDLIMPGYDGLKLLARVRKEAPQVRTIAMTGAPTFHGIEMLEVASGLDADVTISKPFSLGTVVRACRMLIEREAAARAS